MKRAIVNFLNEEDYRYMKMYANQCGLSFSGAILDLAKKSLEKWEDEHLATIALERKNGAKEDYIPSDEFWEMADKELGYSTDV